MKNVILGAGITGLACGMVSGLPVYEAGAEPGGLCRAEKLEIPESAGINGAYDFQAGGGHWIFDADSGIKRTLKRFCRLKKYKRDSAVYFPEKNTYIPYPLQHNIGMLGKKFSRMPKEIRTKSGSGPVTMREWLEQRYGRALCEEFFFPFHETYTAGLYKKAAPQEPYKSPAGIRRESASMGAGYNSEFIYPEGGFGRLLRGMSKKCDIRTGHRVVHIDPEKKTIEFSGNRTIKYDRAFSAIPLDRVLDLAGIKDNGKRRLFTSAAVLNIGAVKGPKCPPYHWVYVKGSLSGFYRVGFYSNVDGSMLPGSGRKKDDRVGIYVERSYAGGTSGKDAGLEAFEKDAIKELRSWGYIKTVECKSMNWIEVAYTFNYPQDNWAEDAIAALKRRGIYQIGSAGKWKFQGIAGSIREGIRIGKETR